MNRLILSLLLLLSLPQLSFAATTDPALVFCNKQLDVESTAFFEQQAAERDVYKKAHPDVIAKLDEQGRQLMVYKEALRLHQPATPPTGYSDSTYTAFMLKQQGDKEVFLAKLAQDKQKCLSSQAAASVTTP